MCKRVFPCPAQTPYSSREPNPFRFLWELGVNAGLFGMSFHSPQNKKSARNLMTLLALFIFAVFRVLWFNPVGDDRPGPVVSHPFFASARSSRWCGSRG